MHEKVKKDALQALYNVITNHDKCWPAAVDAEVVAALGKLLKAPGSTDDVNISTCTRIARITKELCNASSDERLLKKLLADGVMQNILKLAKPEQPALKFDIACAMYALSRSPDPRKVLQWNGVDTMYWLTLHECGNMSNPIRRNVCRALRNFSRSDAGQGAVDLAKEERTMTVMRALASSNHEDIQWQVSGAIYNMLNVPESQELLLSVGAVGLLLDLAGSGYTSVRHVCSACLHMCPSDHMPDLSDPAALSLVLCLLEVDGEKFGELAETAVDEIPYILDSVWKRSGFIPDPTGFTGTWVSIACEVDSVFTSALVAFPEGTYKEVPPQRPGSGTLALSDAHHRWNGSEYFFGGGAVIAPPELLGIYSDAEGNYAAGVSEGKSGSPSGAHTRADDKDKEDHYDSYIGGDDDASHEFAAPIQSGEVAFPRIFSKNNLPPDTVGAIRNSNQKMAQSMEKFPQRLHEESVATNSHMNQTMPSGVGAAISSVKRSKK
jgi:hypothetical protein